MKAALLIVTVVILVLQIEARSITVRFKRALQSVQPEDCLIELGFNSNQNEEVMRISQRLYGPEDNENYSQFMNCYYKRRGFLDKDGNINYNALRQLIIDRFSRGLSYTLSETLADKTTSKCSDIQGDSGGIKAIRVENCILKNLRQAAREMNNY